MSEAAEARRVATYRDVLDAPEGVIAEILNGSLRLQLRPATPHGEAEDAVAEALRPPFQRRRGGPGGWWIKSESEIHLEQGLWLRIGAWRGSRDVSVQPFDAVPLALGDLWMEDDSSEEEDGEARR